MKSFDKIPSSPRYSFIPELAAIFQDLNDITVVQIGAGSGGTVIPNMGQQSPHLNDPVWELLKDGKNKGWKGYLFEPVLSEFIKCVEFYKDNPHVTLFNTAVVDHDLAFDNINIRQSKSMSSMFDEHRKTDEYANITSKSLVSCICVRDINILLPDWIQIDAEGYDIRLVYDIVNTGNSRRSGKKPKFISFEWCFGKESEIEVIHKMLINSGYNLQFKSDWDVIYILDK